MSFLIGFLSGVIITLVALIAAIGYFLLHRPEKKGKDEWRSTRSSVSYSSGPSVQTSAVETASWLNIIVARVFADIMRSPDILENIHHSLHEALNSSNIPDILGQITVSNLNIGSTLPTVENIRITKSSVDDVRAEVSVKYSGGISFMISTSIWLNWPLKQFACLPVSLQVAINHFDGTLVLDFPSGAAPRCMMCFRDTPLCDINIGSVIGHSTKLRNISKISKVVEQVIYTTIEKELVYPNGFYFTLINGTPRNFMSVKAHNESTRTTPATGSPILSRLNLSSGMISQRFQQPGLSRRHSSFQPLPR